MSTLHLLVICLSLSLIVESHMSLKFPTPRDRARTDQRNCESAERSQKYLTWEWNEPMVPMRPCTCHGTLSDTTIRPENVFTAGQTISVSLAGTASHNGGQCSFWWSTDGVNFKKFVDVNHCTTRAVNGQPINIRLPTSIDRACGTRCIFGWTWVPASSAACEIYMTCADVRIMNTTGGGTPIQKFNFDTQINVASCLRANPSTGWSELFTPHSEIGMSDRVSFSKTTSTQTPETTPTTTVTATTQQTPVPQVTTTTTTSSTGCVASKPCHIEVLVSSNAWWMGLIIRDTHNSNLYNKIHSVEIRTSPTTWQRGVVQTWAPKLFVFQAGKTSFSAPATVRTTMADQSQYYACNTITKLEGGIYSTGISTSSNCPIAKASPVGATNRNEKRRTSDKDVPLIVGVSIAGTILIFLCGICIGYQIHAKTSDDYTDPEHIAEEIVETRACDATSLNVFVPDERDLKK